ncbi:MAG: hypothetical protein M3R18_04160 [Pseudomonadota bacterium]|nr:hypothetical protein [Pseudomonadota bacterium]
MTELSQAFFETLLKTQFLPPERMLAYQRGLIERLVRHAREHVPFYRDQHRLDCLFTRDNAIAWSQWAEVPVLTRVDAQKNAELLYAEVIPPDCGEVMDGYTAGSSGTPLAFRVNTLLASAGTATLERGYVWAGLPASFSLAHFRNDRKGEAAYPLGLSYETTMRGATRLMNHLAAQTSIEDQARWLAHVRPDVVMGYPGALALLAQELPNELRDHCFKLAVCLGEVTSEDARAAIEQNFRCPAMDLYSGSEFGPVAVEDCGVRRLFVSEETMFVEFMPAEDFASGGEDLVELVFTPFYNYAMPLIRYATGDFAAVDTGASPDARTLRRLKRVVGRVRGVFILPSGRHWWPSYQNKILRDFIDYKQIQIAQTARDRIEIRYASDRTEPVKDTERLFAYLRSATPEPVEFALARVSQIARRASGKYEDSTCEIDAGSKVS